MKENMHEGVQANGLSLSKRQGQKILQIIKAPYTPPQIRVSLITIEHCLTSTSARVSNSSSIQEDWGIEEDDTRTINWD